MQILQLAQFLASGRAQDSFTGLAQSKQPQLMLYMARGHLWCWPDQVFAAATCTGSVLPSGLAGRKPDVPRFDP